MNQRPLAMAVAALATGGACWLLAPTLADLGRPATALARPVWLPFQWQALGDAARAGDAGEALARAQQLMALVPEWVDGYVVFACQFVLDGDPVHLPTAARGEAGWQRLQIALAWLEAARPAVGRREFELLERMALLPELAAANVPGLADRLRAEGGAARLADHYLAEAERLGAGAALRENRTFRAVELAAALLDAGDRRGALAALTDAVRRAAVIRDPEAAAEWRRLLGIVLDHMHGQPVDLDPLRHDPRMAPLLQHLR